ncbi:hypothetical protein D9756_007902 [Leucocoprinus leucothites]|uniref:Polysaccharide lyase 14 domain-containing protein n=1 Tax=Leucocoprinus leucothites TaxID=201217 RepID=A0A8H5FYB5_9AGAR|nr:hypothetical protein D9756_007902 [Leucoagaricus leucothites]
MKFATSLSSIFLLAATELVSASPFNVTRRDAGSMSNLFPVSGSPRWTTLAGAQGALSLSNTTLRPQKVTNRCPFTYQNSPDGVKSLKAHYPKGSYKPSVDPCGGVSFYAPGPTSVDLTTAKEALFSYSVYFPQGFDFVKGGKLPGLYGGDDADTAVSCSGGRHDTTCWSARLMWRANGAGELYLYLPPYDDPRFAVNKKLCSLPNSVCDSTYGISVNRGSYKFATGGWTTVAQRVKLNDVGQSNGEIELFVNGKSTIKVTGVIIRDASAGRVQGMQVQTFFGGSSTDWATPRDQDVYFANFGAEIISKF